MAILSKGTTYADGDQITSTNLNALVDSATFAAGAVESGGGVQLNGSGQLKVGGNVDIGTSNFTATGTISLGATSFNDNNITNVGSIAVDSIIADNTDVEIDAAGDITLDAGGADIRLKDDGTQFGRLANSSSNLVVASSISDKDILFQGSDGGSTITALTLDMSAAGAATFNDKITAVGTSSFLYINASGDVDIDGTTNLDAVDIDGNVQVDGTVTVGVDDTGYDVKFFGATSGAYIQFDASADKLLTAGGATIDIVKDKLLIGSTAVTTTAAELNFLDGATANTVVNSKAVIYGSGGQVAVTSLSGALANGVTATTQSANDNSTKVATTAYVDAQVTAEDLDFAGDSGSGSVDLDSQTFTIAGATGLDTTASSQTLTVSLDLNELATETSIAQDDFVAMVDNTDSGNGKITFSNLEDQIFGNVSGAVAIAAGGAATVSAVTVADESSDTTCFPLFATAATGSLGPKSGSNLTFNSSSGLLTATTLSGILADGVTATTQSAGDDSTKVATTAYVDAATGGGSGGAFSTLTASDDVNFDSGTFFVDASTDRVGIGTTSPSYKLHLTEASTDFAVLIANSTSSGNGLKIDAGDNSGDRILQLSDKDGNEKMRVGATGLMGIGNASPSSTLEVTGTLAVSDDAAFDIDTLFVDASADKVGINDSTPSEALDVSGSTKISSQLYLKRDSDAWTTSNTWINVNDFGVLSTGGSFALTLNGNGYRGTAGWTSFGQNSQDGATQIHQFPQGYMTFNANSDWPTTTDGTNKVVTERMRIHGDGNVSIGTTSASHKLDVSGTGRFVNDLTLDEDLVHNRTGAGAFPGYSAGTFGAILEDGGSNGSTLYMSRKNSWVLYLATDTTLNAQSDKVVVFSDLNGQSGDADNIVGDITITSSSTAFNTSSDYRLKENEVDITDGIDRLKQLKPYRFNFKRDADTTVDGFFAHEVSDIVPEAITGTKDAMKDQEYEVSPAVYEDVVHPAVEATYDENGQEITPAEEEWTESVLVTEAVRDTRSVPDYQGIDQSKLVPLLTAALQEAVAKIEALEARVQTLEG